MPFVITEPCHGCRYTDCVVVCPMECFHEGEQMLYINPQACTECEACVPECPVEAIFRDREVPERWQNYIAINREMSTILPLISEGQAPLAGAPPRPW
jgi:ferredoxin